MLLDRRLLVLGLAASAAAGVLFVLVAWDATFPAVHRLDARMVPLVNQARVRPLTALAILLHVLGSGVALLPLRLAVSAFLLARRRLRALAVWIATWLTVEILVAAAKAWYARPRPPGSLVAASGGAFPSGHAASGAATALALALLLSPQRRRRAAIVAATAFALAMALSRVYLEAHWLSDAMAGAFLGAGVAATAAGMAGAERRPAIGPG